MPAFGEVMNGGLDRQKHTFAGYKLWESSPTFGEGPQSPKEMNPAWKYQTTGAVALLGCTIFANLITMIHSTEWDYGDKTMDRMHNFSIHLEGLVLALLCMCIEVEWVQMLSIVGAFRNLLVRGLLWALLAAVTYEPDQDFYYFEYIQFVIAGLLTNAVIYIFFGVYFGVRDLVLKPRFDDTL